MAKKKVITRANYVPYKGKKVEGKSMTLQNEVLTVAELLRRHTQGVSIEQRRGLFVQDADLDDEDGEKFRNLDMAEQQDILGGIKAMRQRLKKLEEEYDEAQKERKNAEELAKKAKIEDKGDASK